MSDEVYNLINQYFSGVKETTLAAKDLVDYFYELALIIKDIKKEIQPIIVREIQPKKTTEVVNQNKTVIQNLVRKEYVPKVVKEVAPQTTTEVENKSRTETKVSVVRQYVPKVVRETKQSTQGNEQQSPFAYYAQTSSLPPHPQEDMHAWNDNSNPQYMKP